MFQHKLSTCLCVLALLCAGQRAMLSQSYPGAADDIASSVASTEQIIADLRPKLFGDLPLSEKRVYQEIRFEVLSDSQNPNAFASRKAGVRRVTLTEAIGRVTELDADAFLMEHDYGMDNLIGRYMSFVSERRQSNYQRFQQGLPPNRIPSPYEFAHWSNTQFNKFNDDPKIAEGRNKLWGGGFAFILAHEVAHHVLGHVDDPTGDINEQRRRETAADAWAIDLLVRKRISPVTGILPMLFSYYTGLHPVGKQETESDHPADARRLLAMYEGLESRLPNFRSSIISSGQDYEQVRGQVELALSMVREEVGQKQEGQTSEADQFCGDLRMYVSAAPQRFSNLRGRIDPDGGGEAFQAKKGIEGFSDCTIWIYRDRTLEPTASCHDDGGTLADLRTSVAACLTPQFVQSTRASEDEFVFAARNGVSVRIKKRSGTIDLWIDSPSRD